jgi:LuxR family maltose regulon positive regulatory protein
LVRLQDSSSAGAQRIIPDVLIWQARLQIQEGDLAVAEHTLATLERLAPELPPVHQEACELLCARLLLAQGAADPALALLERLLPAARGRRHALRVFEIQLLIALAHAAVLREDLARQQLADLLAQTCGERLVRLFLCQGEPFTGLLRGLAPRLRQPLRPYAQVLLGASAGQPMAHSGVQSTPALEPLTTQELRVLKLLVDGYTNPEIAQTLVISVNTVKGHVKNLYRKLNVASRIQAGEASRRLSLL